MHSFSGSYLADDVNFLVKLINVKETSLADKEKAIQTGKAHYSEMISKEYLPTNEYLELFEHLTEINGKQMAEAIYVIASHINDTHHDEITLVSLLRAGTPVGVLLKRTLEKHFNRDVKHYSVSIVRDRGIDTNALDYILNEDKRKGSGFVFVDGWTAKGVITRELKHYVAKYNKDRGACVSDKLVVLSDIGGTADVTASYDDYAIPSGILNSTVSGLVSRSIWNKQIGDSDFHGVIYYKEFEKHDRTLLFVDKIMDFMPDIEATFSTNVDAEGLRTKNKSDFSFSDPDKAKLQHKSLMEYVHALMEMYGETDINMVKPGIAEATRVMLRRIPKALHIKDTSKGDVAHLIRLAKDKNIPVIIDEEMPLNAAAVISNVRD
jgi:uracil phosphoribosyltransferase